jgi:hypothetical protein
LTGGGAAADLSCAMAKAAESAIAITAKIAAERNEIEVSRLAGIR